MGDVFKSAKKFVPFLIAVMAWAFGTYLMLKGVKKLVKVDFITAAIIFKKLAAFAKIEHKTVLKATVNNQTL